MRVLVSSPPHSLAGNARALSVTTQSFFDMPSEERLAGRGNPLEFFGLRGFGTFVRTDREYGGRTAVRVDPRMPARRHDVLGSPPRGEFLCVIDGEVALELKGKVFVLHAGDSARDQSTVPYSWSDNGGKEAVFVQVGAPRLF